MFTNTTGKRLYLTADRSKVVEEGDADAATLLVGIAGEIPLEEAERLGLTKARQAATDTKAVKKPPADKGR